MGQVSYSRVCSPIVNKSSSEKFILGIFDGFADGGLILNMRSIEDTINRRIRETLLDKNRNQRWLAEEAGIQPSYLNELLNLNPKRRWNVDYLAKVSEVLDIPVWQLFVDPREVIPGDLLMLAERYGKLEGDNKRIVDAMLAAAVVDGEEPPVPKSYIKKGRRT